MGIQFKFEPQKALEAILYITSRAGTDKYGTLKAIYVADKLHLERYGRYITGDSYRALEQGATPMGSYDIIQHAAGLKPRSEAEGVTEALSVGTENNPHALRALREPDLDHFSDSDLECLDEVIALAARLPCNTKYRAYWDAAHDHAWASARARADNSMMGVEEVASQFAEAEELLEYLRSR